MNRYSWTAEEDEALRGIVRTYGPEDWSQNAKKLREDCVSAAHKVRSGKQCRERWFNHLDPTVNKSKWTQEEEQKLFEIHKIYGNKWKDISLHMQGRTDNDIKNRFYSTLRRSLRRLNKFVGKKNSTNQLREIKPSVLTTIINFIYENESSQGSDQLVLALRQLPALIFKFSTFKPLKQHMAMQTDDDLLDKISIIIELVKQFKNKYAGEQKHHELTKQKISEELESPKGQSAKKQQIQQQEEDEQVKYFPLSVKKEEHDLSMDNRELMGCNSHKYVAREISPIITIERKPSVQKSQNNSGIKREANQEMRVFTSQFNNDYNSMFLNLEEAYGPEFMMDIEQPSVSALSQENDPLFGDLVVVGKQIQPIRMEQPEGMGEQQFDDRQIDEVLYENYGPSGR